MIFRSASHPVLLVTFKIFRSFKPFFLLYVRWGTKDNLLSNITPSHLVFSTTGIGHLSRNSWGSKWRPLFLTDMHTDCLCLRESETVVSCPFLKFIHTKLSMTLDDIHVERSVANLKIIDIIITSNQHQVLNTVNI